MKKLLKNPYLLIALIVGVITFFSVWGYSLTVWGLLGIVFGWIPALIAAVVGGLLWPFEFVLIVAVAFYWHIL